MIRSWSHDHTDGTNWIHPVGVTCDLGQSSSRRAEINVDTVNHPSHYTSHPSGVECITITEHMGFNLGNALKYVWRADLKGDAVEDLRKARWYIDRELQKRGAE